MKKIFLIFIGLLLFASCSSDKVVTSSIIQKRKYRSGFHLNQSAKLEKKKDHLVVKKDEEKVEVMNSKVTTNQSSEKELENTRIKEKEFIKETEKNNLFATSFINADASNRLLPVLLNSKKIEQFKNEDPTPPEKPYGLLSLIFGASSFMFSLILLLASGSEIIIAGEVVVVLAALLVSMAIVSIIFGFKGLRRGDKVSKTMGIIGFSFGFSALFIMILAFYIYLINFILFF